MPSAALSTDFGRLRDSGEVNGEPPLLIEQRRGPDEARRSKNAIHPTLVILRAGLGVNALPGVEDEVPSEGADPDTLRAGGL